MLVHTGAYNPLLCIRWTFLWKAEYARILTSCTRRYIPGCTGLCRLIAVPYYSMVCTRLYLVETNMNNIQTKVENFTRKTISWGPWLRLRRCSDVAVTSQSGTYKYVRTCTEDVPVSCTWYKQIHTGTYQFVPTCGWKIERVILVRLDNPFQNPIENDALNSEWPHRFGLAFQL
jgi:hypothetical protein